MNAINVNMTKKQLFNAKSASLSIKTDEAKEFHTVTGCAICPNEGVDRDKNPCDIGYLATDIGVFGFSSVVCLKNLEEFSELLKECLDGGEVLEARFVKGKSANGEFYSIEVR